MFLLFKNKITVYLPTDIIEYIQHKRIYNIKQNKTIKFIRNTLNVVIEQF